MPTSRRRCAICTMRHGMRTRGLLPRRSRSTPFPRTRESTDLQAFVPRRPRDVPRRPAAWVPASHRRRARGPVTEPDTRSSLPSPRVTSPVRTPPLPLIASVGARLRLASPGWRGTSSARESGIPSTSNPLFGARRSALAGPDPTGDALGRFGTKHPVRGVCVPAGRCPDVWTDGGESDVADSKARRATGVTAGNRRLTNRANDRSR